MQQRYKIQFPAKDVSNLGQDEVFFYLLENGRKERIRLHDYADIYKFPGLYEQVIYERLRYQSPSKISEVLRYIVTQSQERISELRALDLGAGNGMMGAELRKLGISRLVGVDLIQEAYDATERDHPGVYDAYYIADMCNLTEEQKDDLGSWSLDCLTTVAALGFGDVPATAFMEAFNILNDHAWVAFNIKDTFLDRSDEIGFSKLVRELIFSEYLELVYLEKYRHRYSLEGDPLFYFAFGGRKKGNVPKEFLEAMGVSV